MTSMVVEPIKCSSSTDRVAASLIHAPRPCPSHPDWLGLCREEHEQSVSEAQSSPMSSTQLLMAKRLGSNLASVAAQTPLQKGLQIVGA
ncbi:hypothetical protein PoB_007653800 [Plakobranchus ocellatus]|uniref:Uncharacterized protein n=1 Tax=Plakobranchus ocellatus TaxID=259542 RepID=A0AAV4E109_9GAST|nr:hypothetical protein PoB_007653800 [Plakobranchus ocellatus]